MRAILGSYDSELTAAEYSPQLTRRMREAEDMVQKVHAHSSEMEVSWGLPQGQPAAGLLCAGSALVAWERAARRGAAAGTVAGRPSTLIGKVSSSGAERVIINISALIAILLRHIWLHMKH